MTIQELIAELQKYPEDMQVLLDGYEYGFDNVKDVLVMNLTENPSEWDFEGQYITSDQRDGQMSKGWGGLEPIPERKNESQLYQDYLIIKASRGANAE